MAIAATVMYIVRKHRQQSDIREPSERACDRESGRASQQGHTAQYKKWVIDNGYVHRFHGTATTASWTRPGARDGSR